AAAVAALVQDDAGVAAVVKRLHRLPADRAGQLRPQRAERHALDGGLLQGLQVPGVPLPFAGVDDPFQLAGVEPLAAAAGAGVDGDALVLGGRQTLVAAWTGF